MKTWFEELFGFKEKGYQTVKKNLQYENNYIISLINNKKYQCGEFSTPSLKELRQKLEDNQNYFNKQENSISISHIAIDDIYNYHMLSENKDVTFQVASQFNCLEFPSSGCSPEMGVTAYQSDHTQGPACCLACPIATVYRNYFVKTPKNNIGQTRNDQINNLDDLETFIDNQTHKFWVTKNGYTNSSSKNLEKFNKLALKHTWNRDDLLSYVKVGVHLNTQVIRTLGNQEILHNVNQVFSSAISISYSNCNSTYWKIIARIILDATYESTLLVCLLNSIQSGNNTVVLTFVGGGVFGNDIEWIASSIARACAILSHYNIDVKIAHYRKINNSFVKLIDIMYAEYLKKI